ncbi:MAG: branched-chain amino acid ABC transporter permease [Myxococcales bacterium]|nr:branched-chain amino acid ABC transporter permease [Myxococcales bacterium]MBK7195017.1 branched-chain amino acid ABC transporter permease [Myxococcales bacterium]MBP6842461.1 branched-chain amino acid ABC transporter permease [Kofleriaceae bacterium]
MTKFVQLLLQTLTLGSLYALIALGYTLVYGILRFINFAHSDVVTFGAWIAFAIAGALGWASTGSPVFAMPVVMVLAMAASAALGFTIERLAYRPLRKAPRLNVLITAIGVSLLLQNAGQLQALFGKDPVKMPRLLSEAPLFKLAGVQVPWVDVVLVVLTIALVIALQWLVFRTKLGQAMRAVSWSEQTAALMGVPVDKVVSITFMIGSALAAAGGVLYGLKYRQLNQTADALWMLLGLKAFVAAVVGGIGNVRGAVLGAVLIAFIEVFGAGYVSSKMPDLFVFGVLIVMLLFRPAGLLGTPTVEKV